MAASDVFVGALLGSLSVIGFETEQRASGKKKVMAICSCLCGKVVKIEKVNISSGNTSKCTECAKKSRSKKHIRHGCSIAMKESNPEGYNLYTRWQSMKRRCYLETDSHYKNYGGRGISVCDRWRESYENFASDMGFPPTKNHQLDRIDNDGNYEPENCRWVSMKDNSNNKTNSRIIEAFGKSMTQAQWAEKTGIKRETIAMRLRRGWSAELALSKK
jgi:hypothetical protein